ERIMIFMSGADQCSRDPAVEIRDALQSSEVDTVFRVVALRPSRRQLRQLQDFKKVLSNIAPVEIDPANTKVALNRAVDRAAKEAKEAAARERQAAANGQAAGSGAEPGPVPATTPTDQGANSNESTTSTEASETGHSENPERTAGSQSKKPGVLRRLRLDLEKKEEEEKPCAGEAVAGTEEAGGATTAKTEAVGGGEVPTETSSTEAESTSKSSESSARGLVECGHGEEATRPEESPPSKPASGETTVPVKPETTAPPTPESTTSAGG